MLLCRTRCRLEGVSLREIRGSEITDAPFRERRSIFDLPSVSHPRSSSCWFNIVGLSRGGSWISLLCIRMCKTLRTIELKRTRASRSSRSAVYKFLRMCSFPAPTTHLRSPTLLPISTTLLRAPHRDVCSLLGRVDLHNVAMPLGASNQRYRLD